MEDINKKLIVDTSSLIKFIDYYYFDKYNSKEIHNKLIDFLLLKIDSGEIVIIDKVFNELYENRKNKDLKRRIKPYIIDTLYLFDNINGILKKYYKASMEQFFKNQEAIDREIANIENSADLYLIAYGNDIKSPANQVIVIAEETRRYYQKLIEKIPTICKGEGLECKNLPYSLFEIYKSELKFKLN